MQLPSATVVSLATLAALAGCSEGPQALAPDAADRVLAAQAVLPILIMDACDPTTFNAVLGPGTCVRNGGVTFERFIQQLETLGEAPSWHFSPVQRIVAVGTTVEFRNHGGEAHTATEVEEFGGGFVAELNAILGFSGPVPECANPGALTFIAPGDSELDLEDEEGTEKYQCCIHPWMRMTITAREKH